MVIPSGGILSNYDWHANRNAARISYLPAPVPETYSIPAESKPKQKAHRKGELFVLLVETAATE
jgi:hypothetical protein